MGAAELAVHGAERVAELAAELGARAQRMLVRHHFVEDRPSPDVENWNKLQDLRQRRKVAPQLRTPAGEDRARRIRLCFSMPR
ncbi:MAG: hypothetical protein OXI87_13475 [Albidovulum sp.]|nr:hypothetical protein [Albidovulum sp.]